jgi:predicted site-specific integrase-resolvase
MAVQKLYELAEAAPIMGVTLGTLRQYVANGIVPALYIGRKRVIQEKVLEKICSEGLRTKRDEAMATA